MPYQEVMGKFKAGKLHSGGKHGPIVKNRKAAVAIMLSEKRNGAKYKLHGSGPFSKADIAKGFKVCYTSTQLKAMDPDELCLKSGELMAKRRLPRAGKESY